MIRAVAIFFVASVGLIGGLGWVLTQIWSQPVDRHAIFVSGGIALVVQLFTFALVRLAAPSSVMAGWGSGSCSASWCSWSMRSSRRAPWRSRSHRRC